MARLERSGPGYEWKMTGEEIGRLPLRRFEGPIHVVDCEEEMDEALRVLRRERILGFDTESRPSFRKGVAYPVSLLQLAGSRCVYLFNLGLIGIPEKLQQLLENKRIVKTGVAIMPDFAKLRELKDFEPGGIVDLGDVARLVDLKNHGLRGLTAILLGFRISKKERCSNWARKELSTSQINYAATDAWISRELYLKMKKLGYLKQAQKAVREAARKVAKGEEKRPRQGGLLLRLKKVAALSRRLLVEDVERS